MKPFAFWYKRNGPQLQTYHTMLTKRYQWKLPVNFRLALSYRMWPKGQRSTYPNLIAWNAIKWAPNDKMCATADCLLPPRIGRKRKDSSKVTNSLVFLLDSSFFSFWLDWAYRFSLNTQFVILYLGDYRKIWPSNTFRPLPFNFQLSTASFKTSERLTICNCFLARGRKNIRMMFLFGYLDHPQTFHQELKPRGQTHYKAMSIWVRPCSNFIFGCLHTTLYPNDKSSLLRIFNENIKNIIGIFILTWTSSSTR